MKKINRRNFIIFMLPSLIALMLVLAIDAEKCSRDR